MSAYDRIETSCPMLDEIIYNLKYIIKTCLFKNEKEANDAENEISSVDGDKYVAILNGSIDFLSFDDYSIFDFRKAGAIESNIDKYINDYSLIPQNLRDILLSNRCDKFMDEYEERNEYYRKVCGLPPYGTPGVYLNDEEKRIIGSTFNTNKPLHEMTKWEINVLKDNGLYDNILERNKDQLYLKNVDKFITIYQARTAEPYELLYIDDSLEETIVRLFKDNAYVNRIYAQHALSNDAMRMFNDHFDRFIILIIIAQTVCDVINSIPELYINRDVFDVRTCQYFFEAAGIYTFKNIPLKYQIKLVKRLNYLFNYKSTTKNIIDISEIFGFENIQIYQYYLNKYRKKELNEEDKEVYVYGDDKSIDELYDLRFLKVPINEEADLYAKDPSNFEEYTQVIMGDKYWNGPYSQSEVKKQILQQDFTLAKSKYISLDSIFSLTELTFQTAYFTNLIFTSGVDLTGFKIIISNITSGSNIFCIYCYLFALMYISKLGPGQDKILFDPRDVLSMRGYDPYTELPALATELAETDTRIPIRGFNFEVDYDKLSSELKEMGMDINQMGKGHSDGKNGAPLEFTIPKTKVLSIDQLISIFITNKNAYDIVTESMHNASNRKIYTAYKKIYDALFITKSNMKFFEGAQTFTEYLKENDNILYRSIQDLLLLYIEPEPGQDWMEVNEVMIESINNKINATTFALTELFKSDELIYAFSSISTDTASVATSYMSKVLDFFNSYKVTLLNLQNVYLMDKDYIDITDWVNFIRFETKNDYYKIDSKMFIKSNRTFNDKLEYFDTVDIIPYYENGGN